MVQSPQKRLGKPTLATERVARFHLSEPHFDGSGISASWLMAEAETLYRLALADEIGAAAPDWTDAQGRRLFASLTTATLSGPLADIGPEAALALDIIVPPRAQAGWLTQMDLVSDRGTRICVELMCGLSHSTDGNPEMPATLPSPTDAPFVPGDPDARRARNLTALGALERNRALTHDRKPHLSIPMPAPDPKGRIQVSGRALFQDIFTRAEGLTLPQAAGLPQLVARRSHFYSTVAPGEMLDVVTDFRTNVHDLPSWLLAFTAIHRRSDGHVVATCESSHRAAV